MTRIHKTNMMLSMLLSLNLTRKMRDRRSRFLFATRGVTPCWPLESRALILYTPWSYTHLLYLIFILSLSFSSSFFLPSLSTSCFILKNTFWCGFLYFHFPPLPVLVTYYTSHLLCVFSQYLSLSQHPVTVLQINKSLELCSWHISSLVSFYPIWTFWAYFGLQTSCLIQNLQCLLFTPWNTGLDFFSISYNILQLDPLLIITLKSDSHKPFTVTRIQHATVVFKEAFWNTV